MRIEKIGEMQRSKGKSALFDETVRLSSCARATLLNGKTNLMVCLDIFEHNINYFKRLVEFFLMHCG